MDAILIAPGPRPEVAQLAEVLPLAVSPILGKPLAAWWLENLYGRGARRVRLLAADRPDQVRAVLGDGSRWGVELEVVPERVELTPEQAREKHSAGAAAEIIRIDRLPGEGQPALFQGYAGWFHAVSAAIPQAAAAPDRIGYHEIQPGIWVGPRCHIGPGVRWAAPCWIGERVVIGAGARLGPAAIVEDRVLIGSGARIERSAIGPETFIGDLTRVEGSLAWHSLLINLGSGSCLRVPDAFLLSALPASSRRLQPSSVSGRVLALLCLIATAPAALAAILLYHHRPEPIIRRRRAVRPISGVRSPAGTCFTYGEFAWIHGWLRRWPQLWSVARGKMAWIGNRPIDPIHAAELVNDFERLGLTAPIGLISLADAEGCPGYRTEEARAHASFYAARRDRRLDRRIFFRAVWRTIWSSDSRPTPSEEVEMTFQPQALKPQP